MGASLTAAGCRPMFTDRLTGVENGRPERAWLLHYVRNTVVVVEAPAAAWLTESRSGDIDGASCLEEAFPAGAVLRLHRGGKPDAEGTRTLQQMTSAPLSLTRSIIGASDKASSGRVSGVA